MISAKLLAILSLAVPVALRAQESPFRGGQWAAQFTGVFSAATVGVLRFTTSRTAWLLDVRMSGGHSHSESTFEGPTGDTTITSFESGASVSLRVGRRAYRGARGPVLGFVGGGALAGLTHSAGGSGMNVGETNGWSAGAFAELGGTYLITDHFALGAATEVAFTYTRWVSRSSPPTARRTSWSYNASTPNLRFGATIYF